MSGKLQGRSQNIGFETENEGVCAAGNPYDHSTFDIEWAVPTNAGRDTESRAQTLQSGPDSFSLLRICSFPKQPDQQCVMPDFSEGLTDR
jgi:hypothetical protein